ncbi:MAG: quaternary ammonium compound efflux SMR transporter SugE [Hyphomicrobium sp.]|nr:quaternary ammonium compound efflux SMR transporter SugE [Hyphomicrobium sp.]
MAWLSLIIAGLFEIAWAYSMKESAGFTRLWPSIVTVVLMIVSFVLLAYSMKTLPLGTAYAVWTGIGSVGALVVGILLLGESTSALRMLAAVLIVSGLVLMKLSSPE